MPRRGNKGEWSEVYAFAKLLSDGKIFSADINLQPIPSQYYDIVGVIREGLDFIPEQASPQVKIFRNGTLIDLIEVNDLRNDVGTLLNDIINATKASFESAAGDRLLTLTHQQSLKAPTDSKTDLVLALRDPHSLSLPNLGFSIKSYLGSPPTLMNASHATKFIFRVLGLTHADVVALRRFGNDVVAIKHYLVNSSHVDLQYHQMMDHVFEKNCMLVDSKFPQIFAETIKANYYGSGSKLTELCSYLYARDPLKAENEIFYKKKITDFLVATALGMEPATPWDGVEEANGGYIVVKQEGFVICYHIYERENFKYYLLNHCKLDTPAKDKFLNQGETVCDGVVYEDGGEYFINLNRTIRFYCN